ncbi:MAG: hypothetical protein ABSC94_31110 [Polyangiaceae bacterium]
MRAPRGATGINVALYLHTGTELDAKVWELPADQMMTAITTKYLGRLATSRVEVKPGGNSVQSSIDVAAPDGTREPEVRAALNSLRASALTVRRATVRFDHVTASFSTNLGAVDADSFDELAGAALALYANPRPPPWLSKPPLVIDVQNDDDGWSFHLDAASVDRVMAAGGQPVRVRVRYEVADDFRRVYGHLYPYAAQWVTNLTGEVLLELGGAKFVHRGTVVSEWPART